jgi:hypothetical protein
LPPPPPNQIFLSRHCFQFIHLYTIFNFKRGFPLDIYTADLLGALIPICWNKRF